MQKSKRSSPVVLIKSHKIISLLTILILIVAGFFVYEKVALEMNKRDFQQARSAIDSIYADIVHQVGQPDDYRVYNNCDISHMELADGPISCNINDDFIYGVTNENDADKLLKDIQRSISKNPHFQLIRPLSSSLSDKLVISDIFHEANDSYKFNRLSCVAKYIYDTPKETYLSIKDKSRRTFQVNFGCAGLAKAYYYINLL